MDFKKLYDLTAKQRAILDWKQARRERLRKEYLNSVHNPLNKKPFIDEGLQRWVATSMTKDQYFGGTVWQAGLAFWVVIGGIAMMCFITMNNRANKNDKMRRGEVAYVDRFNKFK